MHNRCCCPPESASAGARSRSLTSSQSAARWRPSRPAPGTSDLVPIPLIRRPYATLSKTDFGNGFDFLEDHADPPSQRDDVDAVRVEVLAVEEDLPSTLVSGIRSFMRFKQRRNVVLSRGTDEALTDFSGGRNVVGAVESR